MDDQQLQAFIGARLTGCSWSDIAHAVGVTAQTPAPDGDPSFPRYEAAGLPGSSRVDRYLATSTTKGSQVTSTQRSTIASSVKLLDYEELADWLNDSIRHLRRLVQEGRIPYLKVGHFVRFDPDQVRQWLEDNRRGE
jgi:excisionase family DNA binding protein